MLKLQNQNLVMKMKYKLNINRDNGDIEIFRKLIIVEKPENNNTEISFRKCKSFK